MAQVVLQVLAIFFALKFELLQPKQLTVEALDRKDGKAGLSSVAFGRHLVANVLASMFDGKRSSGVAKNLLEELHGGSQHFRSIAAFEWAFHPEKTGPLPRTAWPQRTRRAGWTPRRRPRRRPTTRSRRPYSMTSCDLVGSERLRQVARFGASSEHPRGHRPGRQGLKKPGSGAGGDQEASTAEMLRARTDVWQKAVALRKKHCGVGVHQGRLQEGHPGVLRADVRLQIRRAPTGHFLRQGGGALDGVHVAPGGPCRHLHLVRWPQQELAHRY